MTNVIPFPSDQVRKAYRQTAPVSPDTTLDFLETARDERTGRFESGTGAPNVIALHEYLATKHTAA